jgi:hypothetical protein
MKGEDLELVCASMDFAWLNYLSNTDLAASTTAADKRTTTSSLESNSP